MLPSSRKSEHDGKLFLTLDIGIFFTETLIGYHIFVGVHIKQLDYVCIIDKNVKNLQERLKNFDQTDFILELIAQFKSTTVNRKFIPCLF